ncbi:MAG: VOC family protein [Patescibacteria group bacterium]
MTRINPYISFKDNASEAMEFYKTVFNGKLTLTTFKEGGAPSDPSQDSKIMHAVLEISNEMLFMAADTPSGMEYVPGKNISMSLGGENEDELRGYWEKLAVGAVIEQPLAQAPWGDTFGMLTDKFGIHWLVNISGKKA